MPAFHIDPERIQDNTLEFGEEEAHHLRVRRIQPGDVIDAIDGAGTAYRVRLVRLDQHGALGEIIESRPEAGESDCRLHLAAAMIKGQRFDMVVEKATEIGVHAIHPLITSRGIVRGEGKIDRWQRVARAAAKQCGRSRIPDIHAALPLRKVTEAFSAAVTGILVADPHADASLEGIWPAQTREIALFVGPEGGLDDDELACLQTHGARSFVWGDRILRADTAAIVLSALVLDQAQRHTSSPLSAVHPTHQGV